MEATGLKRVGTTLPKWNQSHLWKF